MKTLLRIAAVFAVILLVVVGVTYFANTGITGLPKCTDPGAAIGCIQSVGRAYAQESSDEQSIVDADQSQLNKQDTAEVMVQATQPVIDTRNPSSFMQPGVTLEQMAFGYDNPLLLDDGVWSVEDAKAFYHIPEPDPQYGIAYNVERCTNGEVTEEHCWKFIGTLLATNAYGHFTMENPFSSGWVDGQRMVCDASQIRPEFASWDIDDACDVSIPPQFAGPVYALVARPWESNFHDEAWRDVVKPEQMLKFFNVRSEFPIRLFDAGINAFYIEPQPQLISVDNVCSDTWIDATTVDEHDLIRPDFTYAKYAKNISIPPGQMNTAVLGVTLTLCNGMSPMQISTQQVPLNAVPQFEYVPMGGVVDLTAPFRQ